MGMFDTIYCRLPLPDTNAVDNGGFQTKCLNRMMDTYEIREDGYLYKRYATYEYADIPEDPKTIFGSLGQETLITEEWRQFTDMPRRHTITFYTSLESGVWVEYIATFIDFKLMDIIRNTHND